MNGKYGKAPPTKLGANMKMVNKQKEIQMIFIYKRTKLGFAPPSLYAFALYLLIEP